MIGVGLSLTRRAAIAGGTPVPRPDAPTLDTLTPLPPTWIDTNWTWFASLAWSRAEQPDSWKVYKSTNGGSTWTLVDTVSDGSQFAIDVESLSTVETLYAVTAIVGGVESLRSNSKKLLAAGTVSSITSTVDSSVDVVGTHAETPTFVAWKYGFDASTWNDVVSFNTLSGNFDPESPGSLVYATFSIDTASESSWYATPLPIITKVTGFSATNFFSSPSWIKDFTWNPQITTNADFRVDENVSGTWTEIIATSSSSTGGSVNGRNTSYYRIVTTATPVGGSPMESDPTYLPGIPDIGSIVGTATADQIDYPFNNHGTTVPGATVSSFVQIQPDGDSANSFSPPQTYSFTIGTPADQDFSAVTTDSDGRTGMELHIAIPIKPSGCSGSDDTTNTTFTFSSIPSGATAEARLVSDDSVIGSSLSSPFTVPSASAPSGTDCYIIFVGEDGTEGPRSSVFTVS